MPSAPAALQQPRWLQRWWFWLQSKLAWPLALAASAAALLAVFALYTEPDFLITLANMAWTCF
jgi:hypothetical protein